MNSFKTILLFIELNIMWIKNYINIKINGRFWLKFSYLAPECIDCMDRIRDRGYNTQQILSIEKLLYFWIEIILYINITIVWVFIYAYCVDPLSTSRQPLYLYNYLYFKCKHRKTFWKNPYLLNYSTRIYIYIYWYIHSQTLYSLHLFLI